MPLETYNKKRNFKKTAEPEGKIQPSAFSHQTSDELVFVIQMHQASRLHYDFRIELDGVLVSWAVPKGPPLNHKEKHLAMMVEDHPYDYKDFEGNIPEDNYGAGTVMIWDEGTYTSFHGTTKTESEHEIKEGMKKGQVKVYLKGKKLQGRFAFIRFPRAGEHAWLMIKDIDEFDGKEIKAANKSARTGRTLEQIKNDETSAIWESNKKTSAVSQQPSDTKKTTDKKKDKTSKSKIKLLLSPMLATLTDKAFNDKDWIFEIKWDGYRAIADLRDKEINLISRRQNNLNDKFKIIHDALKDVGLDAVLDGEVVALKPDGHANFQLLQNYKTNPDVELVYYVFDILYLDGKDLRQLPLIERKKILQTSLPKLERIRYTDHISEKGIDFFEVAKKNNIEGIIAKKKDSIYLEGERSENWLKIKNVHEQEAVIGGFTVQEKTNSIGSLLVGVYEKKEFIFIGKLGTGFEYSGELLDLLKKNLAKKSHFSNMTLIDSIDYKEEIFWVKPKIVCQIKYVNLTDIGIMRNGVYLGQRDDKKPKDVVLEK